MSGGAEELEPEPPKARRPKRASRAKKLRPEADLAHRLELHSEGSLTDAELVALTGGLDIHHAVALLQPGGLARLRTNLGIALPDNSLAAHRLRACWELSKRLLRAKLPARDPMNRIPFVAKYLLARYSKPGQMVAGALFLDRQHQLIEDRELFRGREDSCEVSPIPYLRTAVHLGASGVIAWHISVFDRTGLGEQNIALAARLEAACDAVGLMLVDYFILSGTGQWCSLRKEGLIGQGAAARASA